MNKSNLHWWILLAMVAGAVIGAVLHGSLRQAAITAVLGESPDKAAVAEAAEAIDAELEKQAKANSLYRAADGIARVFLNLLKLIVIPLVFFSLTAGILGMGNVARLGRIGVRTLLLYMGTSLSALLVGLILVNVIGPGRGVDLRPPAAAPAGDVPESVWEVLLDMVPSNVVAAAADFNLVGIIVFAILFGVCLLRVGSDERSIIERFVTAGGAVMMQMTSLVLLLAPLGIGALLVRIVASTGTAMFLSLLGYMATVAAGLAIHLAVVLPAWLYAFTRRSPLEHFRNMSPALLTAFSTASSSGTLPITMDCIQKRAGVPRRVSSFVLPLGATVNMDGTALYEIVSVLFIAQLYSTVDPAFSLTAGQQATIVVLGLVVSIGAAGIPHAGLVMQFIILKAVGLPVEYTALLWSVDRVLDMSRTAVNVWGDSTVALIVAEREARKGDGSATPGPPTTDLHH